VLDLSGGVGQHRKLRLRQITSNQNTSCLFDSSDMTEFKELSNFGEESRSFTTEGNQIERRDSQPLANHPTEDPVFSDDFMDASENKP
jgi:hypothetical protein